MEIKKTIYERLNGIAEISPVLTSLYRVEMAKAECESVLAEYNATKYRNGVLKVKTFAGVVTKRHVDKGALVQDPRGLHSKDFLEILDASIKPGTEIITLCKNLSKHFRPRNFSCLPVWIT
jgi:hypothetical protein